MPVIFEKRLSASEKERHWVFVLSRYRKYFPARNVIFEIKINDELHQTYIDSYYRLRLGSRLFNKLDLEEPESLVVIEKDSQGRFVLKKKKG